MLIESQIDMALCNQPEPHIELEFHPLGHETIVLLLPKSHPLVDNKNIKLNDLKDEKFLFTPGTCPFRIRIEEMITSEIGRLRNSATEIASITVIKYFVQAGLGIALTPIIAAFPPIPGTVIKSVTDVSKGPSLGILVKRDSKSLSSMTQEFLKNMKQTSIVYHSVSESI